jgi:hypothetical protein
MAMVLVGSTVIAKATVTVAVMKTTSTASTTDLRSTVTSWIPSTLLQNIHSEDFIVLDTSNLFFDPLIWYVADAAMHGTGYGGGKYNANTEITHGFSVYFGNGLHYGYASFHGDYRMTYGRHLPAIHF